MGLLRFSEEDLLGTLRIANLDLIEGSLVDPLGNGEGLVSCHQTRSSVNANTVEDQHGFDQSVLSHSLALRTTVLGEVYKGRSRLWKSDVKKPILDLIWLKLKKQLKRERVCIT